MTARARIMISNKLNNLISSVSRLVKDWEANAHLYGLSVSFSRDLVVDILLRLPVESLLRFKCMCKHWYGFIKSASFKEKYFQQKNNGARLLVCDFKITKIAPIFVKSVVFSLLPKKIVLDVTPEQKVLLHLPNVSDIKCVAGPVYGLFLVQEQIYNEGVRLGLWNPATREFRPLPSAPFEIEHFFSDHYHQFGLGFDLLTQNYKVVWIRDYEGHGVYPHVSVCVYSSCNNSWKNLEFPPSYTSGLPLTPLISMGFIIGVHCM
ncbi:hypothetical protein H5410_023400 [Solanum commersonii]|uniref:F-box domain-containing protein n=1 Tax=Solanum commersonii TaxID=4109 RepID=A0A9J5ZIZ0_SOLCO|nr:hypothetical protein H5410_023400 [Solanum commersonii]